MKKNLLLILLILVFLPFAAQACPPNTPGCYYVGAVYVGDSAAAANPGGVPGPSAGFETPTATFTVNALDFDSNRGDSTYGEFLEGNGNGLVWLTGGAIANDTIYTSPGEGTLFGFWGRAYFPENITITHDDGFWLNLGGTIYNDSAPTVAVPTTLVNAAGIYDFTLYYGAWNGFPEVLQVPGIECKPVPIPVAFWLLGTGLIGLMGIRRKKMLS